MNQKQIVILFLFLSSSLCSNWIDIETKLVGSDGKLGDTFGKSLAYDGKHLFIGAFGTTFENKTNCGAVYIYHLFDDQLKETQKIVSPQMNSGDRFGKSVAVSGNFAVVGAYQWNKETTPNTGFASIFSYDGVRWNYIQTLFPADGKNGDSFGVSVAIHEKWLVVGSQLHLGTGAVYVYSLGPNNEWILFQQIIPSIGGTTFGCSVALEEDTLVIGAYSDAGAGAVYIYGFSGTWVQIAKIFSPNTSTFEREFGQTVAIDGKTVVVGAPGSRQVEKSKGSVFIYTVDVRTPSWELVTELTEFELDKGEQISRFGETVAINGDRIAVGSYDTPGSVWLFEFKDTWSPKERWYPVDSSFSDKFGSSLAMSDSSVFIGTPLDKEHGVDSIGSVFIAYTKCTEESRTPPNCNLVSTENVLSKQQNLSVVPQYGMDSLDNELNDIGLPRERLYWIGVIPVVFLIGLTLFFVFLLVRRRKSIVFLESQKSKNLENQAYHYSDSEESLYASSITEDNIGSETSEDASDGSSSRDVL